MAKVKFFKGSSSNISSAVTSTGSSADVNFFLTTDNHRLYHSDGAGGIHAIGENLSTLLVTKGGYYSKVYTTDYTLAVSNYNDSQDTEIGSGYISFSYNSETSGNIYGFKDTSGNVTGGDIFIMLVKDGTHTSVGFLSIPDTDVGYHGKVSSSPFSVGTDGKTLVKVVYDYEYSNNGHMLTGGSVVLASTGSAYTTTTPSIKMYLVGNKS